MGDEPDHPDEYPAMTADELLAAIRAQLEEEEVGIELWLPADEWKGWQADGLSFIEFLAHRLKWV